MRYIVFMLSFVLLASIALAYNYPKELEQPWDHSPITYSVNRSFPPECDASYLNDFSKALEYWDSGGNGKLSFFPKFKEVSESPDITIQWMKDLENISEEVGGITNIVLVPNKKFISAKIRLACTGIFQMRNEEITKEFSHREMQITTMHELGHALGLDHTDDHYDIMTPRQTIQLVPISFETSSFGIELNVSQRKLMPGDAITFSGKTAPNTKLDFAEIYQNSSVNFSQKRVTSDANGFFENTATFAAVGRFVVEIYSPLSPNVYASTVIFVEDDAEVQVNSPVPAKVFLNGTFVGNSPSELKDLKYGAYEISCAASGYKNYITYVTVSSGSGDELKAEPNRDAVLCVMEKTEGEKIKKGFFEKLSEALKEFFRILFG